MARSATARNVRNVLTFGGRIPGVVGALLLLMLGMSILAVFFPPVRWWTALQTGTLARGRVWQLISWPFVQEDPMGLVFGGLIIFFFGPQLAREEGEVRLAVRLAAITVATAVVTLLTGWLFGVQVGYLGIWPVVDAMVILWAFRHPDDRVYIYFVLPVSGRVLAWITVGTNALFLVWAIGGRGVVGLVGMMPLVAATAISWAVGQGGFRFPPRWRLAWRDWRLERQHRRRSRHLRVVGKNGQRGPNQWLN